MRIHLYRLRSKAHRLVIEFHHRKNDNKSNPLVISERIPNEKLLTLRSPRFDNIEPVAIEETIPVDNAASLDNKESEAATQQQQQDDAKGANTTGQIQCHCNCHTHNEQAESLAGTTSSLQNSNNQQLTSSSTNSGASTQTNNRLLQFFNFAKVKKNRLANVPLPIVEAHTETAKDQEPEMHQTESSKRHSEFDEPPAKRTRDKKKTLQLPKSTIPPMRNVSHTSTSEVGSRLVNSRDDKPWRIVSNKCSLQAALISTGNEFSKPQKAFKGDFTDCTIEEANEDITVCVKPPIDTSEISVNQRSDDITQSIYDVTPTLPLKFKSKIPVRTPASPFSIPKKASPYIDDQKDTAAGTPTKNVIKAGKFFHDSTLEDMLLVGNKYGISTPPLVATPLKESLANTIRDAALRFVSIEEDTSQVIQKENNNFLEEYDTMGQSFCSTEKSELLDLYSDYYVTSKNQFQNFESENIE